jgi:hypothetical protein
VREILSSEDRRRQMVDTNYAIAARHYSYARLREKLNAMLSAFFSEAVVPLKASASAADPDGYLTIDPLQVVFKRFSNHDCAERI